MRRSLSPPVASPTASDTHGVRARTMPRIVSAARGTLPGQKDWCHTQPQRSEHCLNVEICHAQLAFHRRKPPGSVAAKGLITYNQLRTSFHTASSDFEDPILS